MSAHSPNTAAASKAHDVRRRIAWAAAGITAVCLVGAACAAAGAATAWAGSDQASAQLFMQNRPESIQVESVGDETEASLAETLPACFDLRNVDGANYVTPVRMQVYENCWAYAFLASAESNYLMTTGTSVSLSPKQLSYFAYTNPATVRAGLEGDANNQTGPEYDADDTEEECYLLGYNFGGNSFIAGTTTMAGTGLVAESAVPEDEQETKNPIFSENPVADEYAYSSNSYTVSDVTYVKATDVSTVKQLLMEKGAASVGFYATDTDEEDTNFRNVDGTWSYYQDDPEAKSNHDIAIVGWDDTFDAFDDGTGKKVPENPGAWLVKNSWGTDVLDDGYFWLSYEDASIAGETFAFVEIRDADTAVTTYQYDGNASPDSIADYSFGKDSVTAANVFTASENSEIGRVAFQSSSTGVRYTVKVYVNVTDTADPASGTLVSTTEGTCSCAGYHGVDLATKAYVAKGTSYSVAVTLTKDGSRVGLGLDTTNTNSADLEFIGFAKTGQSFVQVAGKWRDLATYLRDSSGETVPTNVRIKAYGTAATFDLADAAVEAIADCQYTGLAQKPALNVSYRGIRLTAGTDYTVAYANNTEIGQATATITGIGNYTGTKTVTFDIVAGETGAIALAGDNRYDTAAKIAKKAFPNGATAAIVATGENYPDALGAAGLAGLMDCPILLVKKDELPTETANALASFGVEEIVIVGGANAVSTATASALAQTTGAEVSRIAGEDRYDTAVQIFYTARERGYTWGETAIVATGGSYADALSISGYAFAAGIPIFLTSSVEGLADDTKTALAGGGFREAVIVGGESAVTNADKNWLDKNVAASDRLGGTDRYDTSATIATYVLEHGGTANAACIATGTNYPDALAGGVLAGSKGSVMLLAAEGRYATFSSVLAPNKAAVKSIYFLGGTSALPDTVRSAAKSALGW